jgi:chemotaxis protein CheC
MTLQLTEKQVDLLREFANIGCGNAITALSQLLKRKVTVRVPEVRLLSIPQVPDVVGGPETQVVALLFRIYGKAKGSILILFSRESALVLIHGLLSKDTGDSIFHEMEASTLKEVGNILTAAYLNAMGQVLKTVLIPSVPGLAMDMAGAVLDSVLIELSEKSEKAVLIETEFMAPSKITGHFLLFPDPESLQLIFEKLHQP